MRMVLALFAFLLALSTAPVMAQKKPAKVSVKRAYVRRDLGFAFNPPPGWIVATRPAPPNTLIEFDRGGDDIYQGIKFFYGTISVTLRNAPANVLPSNLADTMDEELKKVIPEYALSGKATFKVAGSPATAIAFQARDSGNDITARFRYVFVLHNKQLWGFQLKAKLEEFDRYTPEFDKMMASIVWLPKK